MKEWILNARLYIMETVFLKGDAMPLKQSIDKIARCYATLRENLPDLEIDPRIWGPRALEFLSEMGKTGLNFCQCASYHVGHDIPRYVTR